MVLIDNKVRSRTESSVQVEFREGLYRLSFTAMATHCQVAYEETSPERATEFANAIVNWIIEFESKYSRFLSSSLIGQINTKAGRDSVSIDPETETIFRLCDELHFLTEQTLDPSSLPLTRLWNWKAEQPVIPHREDVRQAGKLVGWNQIVRQPGSILLPEQGMGIDLGGMGKEYAVDQITQLAHEMEIASVLVDFGQDIRCLGTPPGRPAWHIGLENPKKLGNCDMGIAIDNVAVASSGNYRRFFRKAGRSYGHIIDSRTGYPVENNVLAATVISHSCVLSGALSTAAVILGPAKGIDLITRTYGAEGMIRTREQTVETKGFSNYVVC